MSRKILIVPVGELDNYLEQAATEGIAEIVEGVPPRLQNEINEDGLPLVYEEPVLSLLERDNIEQRVADLEVALAAILGGAV